MRLGPLLTVTLSGTLGAGAAVAVISLGARRAGPSAYEEAAAEVTAAPSQPRWLASTAAFAAPIGADPPVDDDDPEFLRRVSAGQAGLDPTFGARMIARLSTAMGVLVTGRRGELVELRCQSRTCVARARWPAEVGAARSLDPAVLMPDEPGCTKEMRPSRGEQLAVTSGPVRVSFYFQCPDWVPQEFESATAARESDEGDASPPP